MAGEILTQRAWHVQQCIVVDQQKAMAQKALLPTATGFIVYGMKPQKKDSDMFLFHDYQCHMSVREEKCSEGSSGDSDRRDGEDPKALTNSPASESAGEPAGGSSTTPGGQVALPENAAPGIGSCTYVGDARVSKATFELVRHEACGSSIACCRPVCTPSAWGSWSRTSARGKWTCARIPAGSCFWHHRLWAIWPSRS